jgi:hypothetical protein
MPYVLVTADFPNVKNEERNIIYECLKEKKWTKITEPGRDIDTVWEGYWESVEEKKAIETAIIEFTACSKNYCNPKLVIHFGPNKPTRHNLI